MKTYNLDLYNGNSEFFKAVKITASSISEATIEAEKIINSIPSIIFQEENYLTFENEIK